MQAELITQTDPATAAAEADGWLLAQIVRTAPDPATITVAFDTLRERHSPFFVYEFEASFQVALSGRTE